MSLHVLQTCDWWWRGPESNSPPQKNAKSERTTAFKCGYPNNDKIITFRVLRYFTTRGNCSTKQGLQVQVGYNYIMIIYRPMYDMIYCNNMDYIVYSIPLIETIEKM